MGFLFYLLIAFVVFFFTYKLRIEKFKKEMEKQYDWMSCKNFWIMVLVPLLWVVSLPAVLMWKALEKVTYKFFNN